MSAQNGNPFANKNRHLSGKVPHVPCFHAELHDSRITGDQLRLLLMLRGRAGTNGACWISWETLMEDSGMTRTTLMRNLKSLREFGFLEDASRGFGNSTYKAISDPCDMYPKVLLDWGSLGPLLAEGRTTEQIAELRSRQLVSSCNPRSPIGGTTDDLDNSSSPTGGPIAVPPVDPKESHQWHSNKINKLKEKNHIHLPPTGEGQPEAGVTPSGRLIPLSDGSWHNPVTGEIFEDPDTFDATSDLLGKGNSPDPAAALRQVELRAAQKVSKRRDRLAARQDQKDAAEASGEAEEAREAKRRFKEENQTPVVEVREYSKAVFSDHFDGIKSHWRATDNVKVSQMIKMYDIDLVKRAWKNLCEKWDFYKKDLKLKGFPTMGMLLGFSERFFGDVQDAKTSRQEIEATQPKEKFGWK